MTPRSSQPQASDRDVRSARASSLRAALLYATVATAWIVFSDSALVRLGLPADVEQFVNSTKGIFFVLVTAAVLYMSTRSYLTRLERTEDELHQQEARIRRAYVEVLDAVTGGRLILVTETELNDMLGETVSGPTPLEDPSQLSPARREIQSAVASVAPALGDSMNLPSAVGEALNNALKHAGGGTYGVCLTDTYVQVRIDDEGPGIEFKNLPKATLMSGFSTTSTLGLGFTLMLQLSERVLLVTRPGRTTVVLEFDRNEVRELTPQSHEEDFAAVLTAYE